VKSRFLPHHGATTRPNQQSRHDSSREARCGAEPPEQRLVHAGEVFEALPIAASQIERAFDANRIEN